MSQEELDIIKNQINSSISEIINNLNLTIENNDCLVSKDDFQKLKEELYARLIAISDKCSCQYYMDNTYKFIARQYNIKINIVQNHEIITEYILPFTLTINKKDTVNEKEICKKLIDSEWSLPEIIYEIKEAHNLDMQNELRESLYMLTKKEVDYLLSVNFDKRNFANNYVKELYQIDDDELNQSTWIPDAVECAIKEAINDDYPIEVLCSDWSKDIDCVKCYDFIINHYLNNNPGSKTNKLTNMYIHTLLRKL